MVDGIRLMSFFYAPLSVTNPEAAATVVEKVENEVERLKKSGTLPPGLAEQYDIQLGSLRNPEIPDCEFILYPGFRSPRCVSAWDILHDLVKLTVGGFSAS
jgi:hypothetical protein